jgi:hypothetical protein
MLTFVQYTTKIQNKAQHLTTKFTLLSCRKLSENGRQQSFGEDIGVLRRGGDVQDANFTKGDSLSNKV